MRVEACAEVRQGIALACRLVVAVVAETGIGMLDTFLAGLVEVAAGVVGVVG